MVSIPRDSYVSIPGHGYDKINAAFALGGGLLLTQTLEQAIGLDLPAGCQQLDGRHALGFVRTRPTPRADLARMVNQQVHVSAAVPCHQTGGVAQPVALVLSATSCCQRAHLGPERSHVGSGPTLLGTARILYQAERAYWLS